MKQKGRLVGVGVDSNERSLLIMHFRGAGSWLLFVASANTKATVTSSLIRKRSPPPPPCRPCGRARGKHHPLPKIPAECCCGLGQAGGEMAFLCLLFPFWCRHVQENLIFSCFIWSSLSFPYSSQIFQRRNHNDTIHPTHNFSVKLNLLNPRAWVNNQEQTQSVVASLSSH